MRPMNDFEKSSASYAIGMVIVAGLVAWRTSFNPAALCLTLGIPTLLYTIWGFHQKREMDMLQLRNAQNEHLNSLRLQAEADAKAAREKVEILFGQSLSADGLPFTSAAPARVERRVLQPRENEFTKMRMLLGREDTANLPVNETHEPNEIDTRDQWHS